MRGVKQGKHENVTLFSERVYTLGHEAYPDIFEVGSPSAKAVIETQLVNAFVEGLVDDAVRMHYYTALKSALGEQNLRAWFKLTMQRAYSYRMAREVPMEVNAVPTVTG